MTTKTLGLPLEYKKLPEFFDIWNVDESTAKKNAIIEKILRKHRVKTVLDLTCGTGSQVFYLHDRGYECVGSDFSPALIKMARAKAKKIKNPPQFILGDMRSEKVGTFDAAITIFNAIGHLTKKDFLKALKNIHRNLKPGGIYVFDIFNLDALTDKVITDFACTKQARLNDQHIYSAQTSTLNRSKGILTSYDVYMIQRKTAKPKIFQNTFSLQIYTAQELQQLLTKAGFDVLSQHGMDGKPFVRNKTVNMLTVARKV